MTDTGNLGDHQGGHPPETPGSAGLTSRGAEGDRRLPKPNLRTEVQSKIQKAPGGWLVTLHGVVRAPDGEEVYREANTHALCAESWWPESVPILAEQMALERLNLLTKQVASLACRACTPIASTPS